MKNLSNKWLISILSVIVIGAGIYASFLKTSKYNEPNNIQKTNVQDKPTKQSVDLAFANEVTNITKSKQASVELTINSPEDKITAATINLSFDPSVIKIDDIMPGTFFAEASELEKNIDNKNGKATITLTNSLKSAEGKGTLLKVKITGLKNGKSSLTLSTGTQVAALNIKGDVVKSLEDTIIQVQ